MKKTLFFIMLSFVFLIFSCKNENNSKDNENDSTLVQNNSEQQGSVFDIQEFDPAIVSKLSGIEGVFQYGYKWNDKAGSNLLIFTRETKFKNWDDPDCAGCGDNYVYLKVYHFVGTETNYSLVRLVQDGNQDGCGDPPFALDCDFYNKSISITDLDNDGYAEATFMYYILCASELTPVPTKLIMIENGEKYAIRGESPVEEFNEKGSKEIDFGNADKALVDFASQTWDKYCTSNPENGKEPIVSDFDTF